MQQPSEIASQLLGLPYETLDERAKSVARHIAERTSNARNISADFDAAPSFGQGAR